MNLAYMISSPQFSAPVEFYFPESMSQDGLAMERYQRDLGKYKVLCQIDASVARLEQDVDVLGILA